MRDIRRNAYGKKFAIIVILAVVIFVIQIGKSPSSIEANANEMPRYKYYTCIKVNRGETLWDIADEYITEEYKDKRDYIDEVIKINQLTSDLLPYGDVIVVPYYFSELIE